MLVEATEVVSKQKKKRISGGCLWIAGGIGGFFAAGWFGRHFFAAIPDRYWLGAFLLAGAVLLIWRHWRRKNKGGG